MTVNLFTRWADVTDFARVIDTHRPDVLVVQELAPAAASMIASRFPHHVLAPDVAYSGWGMATVFAGEISEERPGWGRGGHGRVEVEGVPVNLAAVHILDPMHLPLGKTTQRRAQQVQALFDWGDGLVDGEPQVVAGDFNATPRWRVYRRLAERWDDLAAAASRKVGARPSRTWGLPWGPALLRIDHVFGSGVGATATTVVPVKGSDHRALIVDLELNTSNLR